MKRLSQLSLEWLEIYLGVYKLSFEHHQYTHSLYFLRHHYSVFQTGWSIKAFHIYQATYSVLFLNYLVLLPSSPEGLAFWLSLFRWWQRRTRRINLLFFLRARPNQQSSHRTCKSSCSWALPVFGSAGICGCAGVQLFRSWGVGSVGTSGVGGTVGVRWTVVLLGYMEYFGGLEERRLQWGWNICFRYHFILMPFHFSFQFRGFVLGST